MLALELFSLGCSLGNINTELSDKIATLKEFATRLENLSSHSALFLFKNVLNGLYFMVHFVLEDIPSLLNLYDRILQEFFESITTAEL